MNDGKKEKKKVIHPWGHGIPLFIGKEDDLGIQNPYVILYQTGVSEILTILIMSSPCIKWPMVYFKNDLMPPISIYKNKI